VRIAAQQPAVNILGPAIVAALLEVPALLECFRIMAHRYRSPTSDEPEA
jgi:hypothetical protein